MGEIGSGTGTSYPLGIDTDANKESDNVTLADANIPNDLASAILAVQAELGTIPKGTATDVKSFLQQEHDSDGTHGTLENITLSNQVTFAGTGWPSFHVTLSADQTITTGGSGTLVQFDTEDFDSGGYYDSVSNYTFIPAIGIVAKYYFTAQVVLKSLGVGKFVTIRILKNSVDLKESTEYNDGAGVRDVTVSVSAISNGDTINTDDWSIEVQHDHGSSLDIDSTAAKTFFSGSRIA